MITLTCNSSLPKIENMSLKNKTKQNDQEKRKNRFFWRESKPRPLVCKGYASSIALRHLTISIDVRLNINIFNIFCP